MMVALPAPSELTEWTDASRDVSSLDNTDTVTSEALLTPGNWSTVRATSCVPSLYILIGARETTMGNRSSSYVNVNSAQFDARLDGNTLTVASPGAPAGTATVRMVIDSSLLCRVQDRFAPAKFTTISLAK
eukprot:2408705-Rhodomonas_salina.1